MSETWRAIRNNRPLFISILMLAVGLLLWLIERSLPEFPYFDENYVVYPILTVFGSHAFLFLFPVASLSVAFFIVWTARDPRSCLTTVFLAALPLVACALLTITDFFRPGFHHQTSIAFQRKVYHAAFSYGAEPGWDYNLYVYIVYECDGLGLVCKNILTPVSESYWGDEVPIYATAFSADDENNTLYVEIGGERYLVPS